MVMKFLKKQHEDNFLDLVVRDNTYEDDKARFALFYIIEGNGDLYRKRNEIYDFEEHMIKLCLDDGSVDFCSSGRALIKLGFNLYNSFKSDGISPSDLFYNLDTKNMELAINAIRLRFDRCEALTFSQENETPYAEVAYSAILPLTVTRRYL
jgi:hypothetical protein